MSDFLHVLENEVQIIALSFLGLVYVVRIIWLLRFRPRRERTFPEGNAKAGIGRSLMNIALPWTMESARKRPGFYAQVVIFHIGVAAAIAATFIIPYWPRAFAAKAIVWIFRVLIGAGLIVGVMRLVRRISNPAIRLISSPDDYLSLLLVIFFFAAGFLAVPNNYQRAEWPLILFFGLTAFLLIVVPFTKIGHYLYYPFTRFFLGRALGHRGVLRKGKGPAPQTMPPAAAQTERH
jgi:hypothetical protein